MSRKISGCPEYRGGRWQVKVTKPDRSRPWIDLPGSIPASDPERAKRVAVIVATRIRNGDSIPMERGETVLEYGARWYAWRKKHRVSSAGENLSNLRVHFYEKHGALPMAGITREHLEDFVTHLDERVLAEEISWRTAKNVWGSVAVMFRDGFGAKDRAMRVVGMSVNPAAGVAPPDKGAETALQFLHPSEFLKLVQCKKVPLARRRLYAYAVYTYSRAGESSRSRGAVTFSSITTSSTSTRPRTGCAASDSRGRPRTNRPGASQSTPSCGPCSKLWVPTRRGSSSPSCPRRAATSASQTCYARIF